MSDDRVNADILIVDGDPATRTNYRSWLECSGYKVSGETDNGKTAFRLCNRYRHKLIVTAISIEDWDGIDYIAANGLVSPEDKILVIDYLTEETIGELMIESNVVSWLQKPATKKELLRAVRVALQ